MDKFHLQFWFLAGDFFHLFIIALFQQAPRMQLSSSKTFWLTFQPPWRILPRCARHPHGPNKLWCQLFHLSLALSSCLVQSSTTVPFQNDSLPFHLCHLCHCWSISVHFNWHPFLRSINLCLLVPCTLLVQANSDDFRTFFLGRHDVVFVKVFAHGKCSKRSRMNYGKERVDQKHTSMTHACYWIRTRNVNRSLHDDVQVFALVWRTRSYGRTIMKRANGRSWYRWCAFLLRLMMWRSMIALAKLRSDAFLWTAKPRILSCSCTWWTTLSGSFVVSSVL